LAVASRLSVELPHQCILVIEAGPAAWDEEKINIPGRKGSTLGGPYDWNFTTVAQPDASNRTFNVNRGKVLGGSSALNLMTWDRAAKADYDAWEELGNEGWNWENFIAAMEAVETFQPDPRYDGDGVGYDGPIQTLINRIIPPHQNGFIPALESLGVPENKASLNGNPLGVMTQPSNVRASNYTRSYSPTYLSIAGPNLHVRTNTTVSRLSICDSDDGLTADGIYIGDKYIHATKEVILSAGSIQSPGLLELSGIGQEPVITAAGIQHIHSLPGVGENLQDHLRIQTSYYLNDQYASFDDLRVNTTLAAEQLALWRSDEVSLYDYTGSGYTYMTWNQALGANGSSLMTSLAASAANTSNPVDAKKLSYLTTSLNSSVPELEVIFSDGYTGVRGVPKIANHTTRFFSLIAVVQHPLARGSIHLNASSPTGKPTIDPNYLSNPYDLRAAAEAAKFTRRIANTPALRKFWADEYEPGMEAVETDEEWLQFARDTTLSIYHPMGTCAMGKIEDGGVVDADLKVHGVKGLRIVDASVIPIQPSAHIQTMVYGIAEIAAGKIAKDHES
jgi:choline dehydrogenase-like flavoprotein